MCVVGFNEYMGYTFISLIISNRISFMQSIDSSRLTCKIRFGLLGTCDEGHCEPSKQTENNRRNDSDDHSSIAKDAKFCVQKPEFSVIYTMHLMHVLVFWWVARSRGGK